MGKSVRPGLSVLIASIAINSAPVLAKELASDGNFVRLEVDDNYRCASETTVKIITSSADYYDRDADTIQRLANTSGEILSYKCDDIQKLKFEGFTDNVLLFSGNAERKDRWAIQTNAGPLEALALYYARQTPDFLYLGAMNMQIKPYLKVTGIFKTEQFKAYNAQAKRMLTLINGDTDKFRDYVYNPGHNIDSLKGAKEHYQEILEFIRAFSPRQVDAYDAAYRKAVGDLRERYWASRVTPLLDQDDITADRLVADAKALLDPNDLEFNAYVDRKISDRLDLEISDIIDNLPEATLYQVKNISDFLTKLPEKAQVSGLPQTAAMLEEKSQPFVGSVVERIAALYDLAVQTVQDAGDDYTGVETILNASFSLAGEFEDAGFMAEAESLIAAGNFYIEDMLKRGLDDFKGELSRLDFTPETAVALQEQAAAFTELSSTFGAFSDYRAAVDDALVSNRKRICAAQLDSVKVEEHLRQKQILVNGEPLPLLELACRLYANEHAIATFTREAGSFFSSDRYTLGIQQSDGTARRFSLVDEGGGLIGKADLSQEPAQEISVEVWNESITQLVASPPSGKPDPAGVRECDRLAADPNDPKKRAPGVDFRSDSLDPNAFDRALDACIAAAEDDPRDIVQSFQLGRLLWQAGDQETARSYLGPAAEAGYPAAQYYQGEILLEATDDQNAFVDALTLFKEAAKGGYDPAREMINELNPDGIDFFKEIPPPTEEEIAASLKGQNVNTSMLGVNTRAEFTGARIKECFQTGSHTFSCEYKPILQCSMGLSGYGNDRGAAIISQFFSNMAQADCNGADYTFGSFKKGSGGQWDKLSD